MDTIKTFLEDPLLNGLGFIVGLLSLLLAILFYRRGIRTKQPSWSIRSNNIIANFSSRLEYLSILYGGQKVETLTVSRLVFWNAGRETIYQSDIASTSPLRIVARSDVKLLDLRVLATNNRANLFSAVLDPGNASVRLDFEYLDEGQGAVVQVVHTGSGSADLSIVGTVKGAPIKLLVLGTRARLPLPTPIQLDEFILNRFSTRTRRRIMVASSFLVAALAFIFLFLMLTDPNRNLASSLWTPLTLFFASCTGLALGYGFGLQGRAPIGLELFEESSVI